MLYPFLEKYEIVGKVGQGSFGKSYLAKEKNTYEFVVIKIIENDNLWKKLKKNKQLLTKIDNKYIMHIYEFGESGSYKYIVQEFIQGNNLNVFMSNNNLLLEDLLNISYGIVSALQYLETFNLSHKDIKPSNIIYDKSKKIAKLTDLDYVGIQTSVSQNYVGTIKYSSPEQIIDNRPSNKADVYSYGMVLCFMILGNVPFDVDMKKTIYQIKIEVENVLKKITGLKRDIVCKIIKLLSGLLDYDPQERLTPSNALQQIKEIIKVSDEGNQGKVIIHECIKGYNIINNNIIYDGTILEKSLVITNSIKFSNIKEESTYAFFENDIKRNYSRVNLKKPELVKKIEEDKNIYREQLLREYDNILFQAKVSFGLWVCSFVICFAIIFVSIYMFMNKNYVEGIITIILDSTVIAIQKLFNIREDYYRKLMEQKIKHLETGDYLEYAFEKIEKLHNLEDQDREILELIKTIKEHTNKNEGK